MTARDERVVDREVGIDAADDELGVDRESLPGERPSVITREGTKRERLPPAPP